MIANHRNSFSQVLEAIGSRSRCGQGHALSGGCGGGLCPLPAALGGCEPPWACGHITCLCLHLHVASPCISSKDTCPWIEGRPGSRTISSGESDLHYTCRDPASESGHVHRFWVDVSLGGHHSTPQLCISQRAHTGASALLLTYMVPPDPPAPAQPVPGIQQALDTCTTLCGRV